MWYLAGNKNKCDGLISWICTIIFRTVNEWIHSFTIPESRILLTSTSEVYIYIYMYGDPLVHPQTESSWANFNPIGMFSHCSKPIYLHFHCSNKLVVSLNLLQLVHDACGLALPQSNSYEISKVLFHCNMIKGFSINSQMWKIVGHF
jgi:hypothetical protein